MINAHPLNSEPNLNNQAFFVEIIEKTLALK